MRRFRPARRRPSQQHAISRRALFTGSAATGALLAAYAYSDGPGAAARHDDPLVETARELDSGIPRSLPYVRPDGPVDVPPPRRRFYSPAASSLGQTFGDLYLPATANPALPVVVMVHGGGWSDSIGLDYLENCSRDLASFDVAVWNIEYRRVGSGGGWPTTVADVCDAIDHLPEIASEMAGRLDLSRVVAVGHSAGGHLALWAASRDALPDHLPGSTPTQRVSGCVALAGVSDMFASAGHGRRSVSRFLSQSPSENPARYHAASPVSHLPTGVPSVLFHGDADGIVPLRQSEEYVRRAREAGDDSRLEVVAGANHDPWSDIDGGEWRRVRRAVLDMLEVPSFA